MNKTPIGYLDYTWNPICMRCSPVSEGCKNCWHLRMVDRLKNNPKLPMDRRVAYSDGYMPLLLDYKLHAPLRLKKPARIGVQFMGDLFHDAVPIDCIGAIFEMMASAAYHNFIVLTKRPERMVKFLNSEPPRFTNKNIWLGVSVENQQTADERIPLLLQTPAAHRWVSYEPALGAVDFKRWIMDWECPTCSGTGVKGFGAATKRCSQQCYCSWYPLSEKLDWLVMGGETGPGARPMHPDWVRDVKNQCESADVPFFFKSWGEWAHEGNGNFYKIGAKHSGHLIAGKEYRQMPF